MKIVYGIARFWAELAAASS